MVKIPITCPEHFNPQCRFLFVVATKGDVGTIPLPVQTLQKIVVSGDYQADVAIEYNNKEGLPVVYNRALDEYEGYDVVVFLHDDIIVSDCQIYDKLVEAKARGMDLVGVAGGKGWIPPPRKDVPWGWTQATRDCGMGGMMVHLSEDRKFFFSSSYGSCPCRTLTVDGCFMAFMNGAFEKGLKFNQRYDFDFYDMAVSMDAYKLGLKTGVEPILLQHLSRGEGLREPKFLVAQQKFLEEYFGI